MFGLEPICIPLCLIYSYWYKLHYDSISPSNGDLISPMSGDFSTVCGSYCIKVTWESLVKSTELMILYPLNFKSELVCVGQISLLWNQVKFIELFFFKLGWLISQFARVEMFNLLRINCMANMYKKVKCSISNSDKCIKISWRSNWGEVEEWSTCSLAY